MYNEIIRDLKDESKWTATGPYEIRHVDTKWTIKATPGYAVSVSTPLGRLFGFIYRYGAARKVRRMHAKKMSALVTTKEPPDASE